MRVAYPMGVLRWTIVGLALATGLIHLVLGILSLGDGGFLPISFILNGLAYIGLVILLYFVPQTYDHSLVRLALVALAAVTIILYFVFNGVDGLSSPVGLLTKAIEVALIILLLVDWRPAQD